MEDWEKQELERQISDQAQQIKSLQDELQNVKDDLRNTKWKLKDDLSNAKWELNNKINDKSYYNVSFTLWIIIFVIAIIGLFLKFKG